MIIIVINNNINYHIRISSFSFGIPTTEFMMENKSIPLHISLLCKTDGWSVITWYSLLFPAAITTITVTANFFLSKS